MVPQNPPENSSKPLKKLTQTTWNFPKIWILQFYGVVVSLELEVSRCPPWSWRCPSTVRSWSRASTGWRQSQHRVEALVAKERRLQAQEQQRRQERDEALGRAQELSEQLENTGAQLQQTQQQLQEQLEQVAALRELEASKQALLAEREDCIHLLEMERRRLHNDIQELRGNIRVFCRVRPLLPEELQRQRGLPHLHFPEGDARSLLLTRPDDSQVGRERRAELRYDFSFDRVFPPAASQQDIFKEIQLLVQVGAPKTPKIPPKSSPKSLPEIFREIQLLVQ
ncbi:uncharacterized protein VK521_016742, partial [Ammospiza maritima maritima]